MFEIFRRKIILWRLRAKPFRVFIRKTLLTEAFSPETCRLSLQVSVWRISNRVVAFSGNLFGWFTIHECWICFQLKLLALFCLEFQKSCKVDRKLKRKKHCQSLKLYITKLEWLHVTNMHDCRTYVIFQISWSWHSKHPIMNQWIGFMFPIFRIGRMNDWRIILREFSNATWSEQKTIFKSHFFLCDVRFGKFWPSWATKVHFWIFNIKPQELEYNFIEVHTISFQIHVYSTA